MVNPGMVVRMSMRRHHRLYASMRSAVGVVSDVNMLMVVNDRVMMVLYELIPFHACASILVRELSLIDGQPCDQGLNLRLEETHPQSVNITAKYVLPL